jgi:hypothetical protein
MHAQNLAMLLLPCCPACCVGQAYNHGDHYREDVVRAMAAEDRVELEYLQSLPEKFK